MVWNPTPALLYLGSHSRVWSWDLLFILYIRDLLQNIISQCRLFADAALLFTTTLSVESF